MARKRKREQPIWKGAKRLLWECATAAAKAVGITTVGGLAWLVSRLFQ
jgi:hypothetical protein